MATLVAIGWDRPLATFYAQVFRYNRELEEEEAYIWEGAGHGQIIKAEDAIAFIRLFAEIPDDLGSKLELDRLRTLGNTKPNRPRLHLRSPIQSSGHFVKRGGGGLFSDCIRKWSCPMPAPVTALTDARTQRIAELNDRCRLGLDRTGKIVVTSTCLATIEPSHDPATRLLAQWQILSAVRAAEFSADCPERDMAWFAIGEHKLMLKIDYYDLDLTFHSEDAADPAQTRRVMTVMLTSDY